LSYFDLVLPLPPSAEQVSYFAHLDSIGSHSDDSYLALPNPHPETPYHPIEIQAPKPSRNFIDSEKFRRLLRSGGNDIGHADDDIEVARGSSLPCLQPSLESGDSSPSGPLTPAELWLDEASLAIASGSSSHFGIHGSTYGSYQSKKSSPFSSLFYVGQPHLITTMEGQCSLISAHHQSPQFVVWYHFADGLENFVRIPTQRVIIVTLTLSAT
jgi:hypothetical protein